MTLIILRSGGLFGLLPLMLILVACGLFGLALLWWTAPQLSWNRLIAAGLFCCVMALLVEMLGGGL